MTRYIVTEDELLAFQIGELVMADITRCLVPEWATHLAGDPYPGYDTEFKRAEEIK